jgi:hypothetical protein
MTNEKEDKLRREIEKKIDESKRQRDNRRDYSDRDVTRVQAPDQWPDPPIEKDDD